MISVVVVDDEQLVRSGFAALLASDPEITWSAQRATETLHLRSSDANIPMLS